MRTRAPHHRTLPQSRPDNGSNNYNNNNHNNKNGSSNIDNNDNGENIYDKRGCINISSS